MRKKAIEKFGRRHLRAEERASTKVLRGECAWAVRTASRPVPLQSSDCRAMRSETLREAGAGLEHRASWVTDRILASEQSHDRVRVSF